MTERKRSTRASARRSTLKQINEIKAVVETMRTWWTTRTTVFVPSEERKPGDNHYLRPREQHEYPENDRKYWAGTVKAIDKAMQDLHALREHCIREYHNTPEEGKDA